MVRKIFLLRHGQAVFPEYGMSDMDRPLTSRGTNQIRDLGGRMLEKGILPQLTYCSSSLRTRQTFNQLSESLKRELEVEFREEIYEASVNTLFKMLCQSTATISHILLVGHNPGLSYLAEYLSGEEVGTMDTGDMVVLEYAAGSWGELTQGVCSHSRI